MKKETFDKLYKMDIAKYVEKRSNGNQDLSYLSWANAIKLLSAEGIDFHYEIMKWDNQYYTGNEEIGYMVGTQVTIDGDTKEMFLPVMDGANNTLKLNPYSFKTSYGKEKQVKGITMFDINKAIMRCLVKNIAVFGLGLSLYIGEDLPNNIEKDEPKVEKPKAEQPKIDAKEQEAKFQTIRELQDKLGISDEKLQGQIKKAFAKKSLSELTKLELDRIITGFQKKLKEA